MPPSAPTIIDENRKEVGQFAGPYEEGGDMKLNCIVTGGKILILYQYCVTMCFICSRKTEANNKMVARRKTNRIRNACRYRKRAHKPTDYTWPAEIESALRIYLPSFE